MYSIKHKPGSPFAKRKKKTPVKKTPSKRRILAAIATNTPIKRRPLSYGSDAIKKLEKAISLNDIPSEQRLTLFKILIQ